MRKPLDTGPFKCHFCSATLRSKEAPEAIKWEWVTGYLPKTEHCCPKCLQRNGAMWREIVRRAAMAATKEKN